MPSSLRWHSTSSSGARSSRRHPDHTTALRAFRGPSHEGPVRIPGVSTAAARRLRDSPQARADASGPPNDCRNNSFGAQNLHLSRPLLDKEYRWCNLQVDVDVPCHASWRTKNVRYVCGVCWCIFTNW